MLGQDPAQIATYKHASTCLSSLSFQWSVVVSVYKPLLSTIASIIATKCALYLYDALHKEDVRGDNAGSSLKGKTRLSLKGTPQLSLTLRPLYLVCQIVALVATSTLLRGGTFLFQVFLSTHSPAVVKSQYRSLILCYTASQEQARGSWGS